MNRSVVGTVVLLCTLALVASLPTLGQERFGNLAGVAADATGGVVPGVTVTITNKATNRVFTTTTRSDGAYNAPDLEPGRYSVQFEKQGFSRSEVPDVIVLIGKTSKVDASMQVGSLEQTVQVTEAAPLIDTSSTMIAHNVTSEELDRLPKGRSFQAIAVFSPSVNTGQLEGGYQVNGASAAENNYYIDGVSTNSLIDGSARQNAVMEYLQEVQVKTTGLEAEYGGALGGVVTAVTKSGGNAFHGEMHYYSYGNKLGADPVKRYQLDPTTEENPVYVQDKNGKDDFHEFGGSLGGPFAKNRLWFFTSISPRWRRASYPYTFIGGDTPETGNMDRKASSMNWFNKVSFDPSRRVRMNFTWLYTPTHLTGSLFAYNGIQPNVSSQSLATAKAQSIRGYSQPEQSYTGNVDFTISSTSLLSVKAGRYYLDYKDTGIPYRKYSWWRSSSIGMEGVPADLQRPSGYTTPSSAQRLFDITTRTYAQADFNEFLHFGGQHNFKAGVGVQKNVNSVSDQWFGPDGRINLWWGQSFRGDQGTYGFYSVDEGGTIGSAGATITHLYVQDSWRVHRRLTLNIGLRSEREYIPSFARSVQQYAFKYGFGDKIAPRLGASFDVFGNGKLKISGGWGRFFDWTKFDLARGTFGADVWHVYYRSLDTTDGVRDISLNNLPGRNLWPGPFRNRRVPGFDLLDQKVKPMSVDGMNIGAEYEIRPQMVFSGRWVRSKLNRTIEDMGALDAEGNEVYRYGNPGEGSNLIAPVSGATCVIQLPSGACGFKMPKAKRQYDAMELSLTRRFSAGWLANASYVYSRLWGNYSGLQSTDEIRPPTLGYSFSGNQAFSGQLYRPGGNANRYFDLDEAMWDAKGRVGLYGLLPTDRPHVVKLYGAKTFKFGTEIGGFFRIMSGTPLTTQVTTINDIPVYVSGRGDMGRSDVFNQTDLLIAHEIKIGEVKRLRFEMNMLNLFNQKTSMMRFDRYNREEHSDSAGIDLSGTDLSKGFDWQAMVAAAPAGAFAKDPRFGKDAVFNPGFSGRFLVKFIF